MTNAYTIKLRINELKAMHNTMLHMNNENAYMEWTALGVPDEPGLIDYELIAEDDVEFKSCTGWFLKVLTIYYKDGFVS